jgi:prophage regulatory protein
MRELPTNTKDLVGVRSLNGRQTSHSEVPRASDTAGRSERGADASRVLPRLLRFPAVRERTGLSRSTIWRLERRGEFPRHHRISPNVVAWSEEDVHRWIEARVG